MRPEAMAFVQWQNCPACSGFGATEFLPDGGPDDTAVCERCKGHGRVGSIPRQVRRKAWIAAFIPPMLVVVFLFGGVWVSSLSSPSGGALACAAFAAGVVFGGLWPDCLHRWYVVNTREEVLG